MIRVQAFDHLVLVVSDVERSLAWYTGVLGLEGVRVDEWRAGQVFFPSVRIDGSSIIDLLQGARSGENVNHFCLVVGADTDLARVAVSGDVDVVEGPTEPRFGARGNAVALYVRDPDGNVVELRRY